MSEVSQEQEALDRDDAVERPEVPTVEVKGLVQGVAPSGSPFTLIKIGEARPLGEGDAVISEVVFVGDKAEKISTTLGIEPDIPRREISIIKRAVALGCAAAFLAVACEQQHSASDDALQKMYSQLTSDQMANLLPPSVICGTQLGDSKFVPGTLPNGDKILTFIRNNPETGHDSCYYIKHADVLKMVDEVCEAKLIELPGTGNNISQCVVDGDNAYYSKWSLVEQVANIQFDAAENATVENNEDMVGWMSPSHAVIIFEDGVAHLLYDAPGGLDKRNLQTGETTSTPYDTTCGIPHKDPDSDTWVGSKLVGFGGVQHCMLVTSSTLEGLMSSLQFVPGIMIENNQIIGDAKNPRIIGDMLIFEGDTGDGTIGYYAVVAPPDNPDVGPDVQEQDLGEQDTGVLPDLGEPDLGDPDTGVLPDLGDPDTGVEPDLGEPDTWVEPDLGDPDTGPEPDIAELPDTQVNPEDTAETSDTSIPGDESSGPEEISQPDEISDAIDAAEEAWKEIIETSQPDELEGPDELTIPDEASAPDEFTQPDEVSTPDELAQADEATHPDKGQKDHGTLPEWGSETTIVDVVGKDLPGPDNSGPEVSTGTPGGGCSSASEGQGQTRNSLFLLLGSIGAMMAARLRRKENEEEQVR